MTDYPKINTELFQKIYDQIVAQPETHEQACWEDYDVPDCGTTRCIAGWAVFLGHDYKEGESVLADRDCWLRSSIQGEAQRLLGITDDEAYQLFLNTTDNDDARELVAQYAMKGRADDAGD